MPRGRGEGLLIIAGNEYGCGSSRDTAAKGPWLIGVRGVLARGFERIHRSNLVGMGILPLQFQQGESAESLNLDGSETFDLLGLDGDLKPSMTARVRIHAPQRDTREITVLVRLETAKIPKKKIWKDHPPGSLESNIVRLRRWSSAHWNR